MAMASASGVAWTQQATASGGRVRAEDGPKRFSRRLGIARNKRSLVLDLRQPRGRELLRKLIGSVVRPVTPLASVPLNCLEVGHNLLDLGRVALKRATDHVVDA